MKWFRFYTEALDDPKVQRLPGELFKAWVNLLCLANESEPRGFLPTVEDIAFRLRVAEDAAGDIIAQLMQRGLLDTIQGTLRPHNWDERQHPSDDVAARVQRHRAKQAGNDGRNVTGNVSVTPQTRLEKTRLEKTREERATPSSSGADARTASEPTPDPQHIEVAALLARRIRENNPKARDIPGRQITRWANTVRLMVERDGRTLEDIRAVIDWSQSDTFWLGNVLSMEAVRRQFDRLTLAMNAPARASPSSNGHRGGMTVVELAERARRLEAEGR